MLRPLELTDVDEMWPFVTDAELTRHMTWAPHQDRAETVGFVESTIRARQEGTGYTFAIRKDGALCGLIGLDGVTRQFRAWRKDVAEESATGWARRSAARASSARRRSRSWPSASTRRSCTS